MAPVRPACPGRRGRSRGMTGIAVLNAGGWGTALAAHLGRSGHAVRLWARRAEQAAAMRADGENRAYLPGVPLPPTVEPTADLAAAVDAADVVVLVPISAGLRDLARQLAPDIPPGALVVHGTKGLARDSLRRLSVVVAEELGPAFNVRVAALSGPTHAEEVGRGIPTAAVIACPDAGVADALQAVFNGPTFRVYTNADLVGVELCGALK